MAYHHLQFNIRQTINSLVNIVILLTTIILYVCYVKILVHLIKSRASVTYWYIAVSNKIEIYWEHMLKMLDTKYCSKC